MIHNVIKRVFTVNKRYNNIFVRYSALFINGRNATDTFVFLTPHIDFPERIKDKQNLQNILARRKANIDLNKLEKLWAFYKELDRKKECLDKKKEEICNEISIQIGAGAKDAERLKVKLHLIKENIKKIKLPLWDAEQIAVVETLKLPNLLHPLTPDSESKVIFESHAAPNNCKNHLEIGRHLKIFDFTRNEHYYLKDDAAIFELGAKFYFSNILKRNHFVQFSNTDFVKSIIIEGCGENHTNSDSTFILHHNEDTIINIASRLHLTGAGSLYSFFAYHAKNVIHSKVLPIKYFAMGRQYKPSPEEEDCLFHVSQSSVIQVFQAASVDEVDSMLQELIDVIKVCYNNLGYHFRLSMLSADKLCMWESLRVSVEMYSSSLKSYIEVGNVSLSGDFISKRLNFKYTEDKKSKFPHIISGTILHVPKFLACVLEQDGEFVVPKPFKVDNWSM